MAETNYSERGYDPDSSSVAKANGKFVFDRETAEAEFERYCEANDIDCDIDGMSDEDRKGFEPIKKRFVKACMQGRVKVNGTELIYTVSDFSPSPFRGEEVAIKRSGGKSFMEMDNYKETQSIRKMNGFMSAMTGKEPIFFAKIDGKDWLFFKDIATLFLVD